MRLYANHSKCSGCNACRVACSLNLFGVSNPKMAALIIEPHFPAPGVVGAHHNRAWAITYDLQVGRDKVVPEKVARVIWLQNFRPMFDVLGGCRLQWVELGIDRDLYVPLLEAITGIHRSWEDMEKAGERIWNLTRLYWSREIEGFGRDWDQPPARFYTEAPATGATANQITNLEDVQKLLDMYYEQRGWHATGHLTPATLERLNLTEFAVN